LRHTHQKQATWRQSCVGLGEGPVCLPWSTRFILITLVASSHSPEPRRTPLRRGSPLSGERKVAGNRNPKPKSSRARQAWSRPPDSPSKSTIEHGFAPDCIPNFRGCLSQTTSRPPGPPHLSEDARTCWTLRGDHPQPHGTIIIPSACRRSGRHNIKTAATGMRLARHFG
jgi:hypothetical protein